jgi:hypothetical protein
MNGLEQIPHHSEVMDGKMWLLVVELVLAHLPVDAGEQPWRRTAGNRGDGQTLGGWRRRARGGLARRGDAGGQQ